MRGPTPAYTTESLQQWSCVKRQLPSVSIIKQIHVYDFDNTLFCSPLPNPVLWHFTTVGLLQTYETLAFGGWWHDNSILAATGEGEEKEEPRGWAGHWNETVVELVELSVQAKDVVTVLLTGRGEHNFADLVTKICNSRNLDFDMVVLKPETNPEGQKFENTMAYKNMFFSQLVSTYKEAEEIKIYEDRPKHVKGFKDFFERFNKSMLSHHVNEPPPPRKPINADVIHVCQLQSILNPETEVQVVRKAVDRHNTAIAAGGPTVTKTVRKYLKIEEHFSYFGYMINQTDSARLLTLFNIQANLIDGGEVKLLATNILITPYYPRRDTKEKVGGMGNKVTWQVTGIGRLHDSIWAARVAPVTETQIFTSDETPHVVLAIRKGARQIDANKINDWKPVPADKAFMFETTVAIKSMLKIEDDENRGQQNNGGRNHNTRGRVDNNHKRKFGAEDSNHNKNNNSYARVAAGSDRDDGFIPRGGRFAARNAASKANFNNRNNPNTPQGRANNQNAMSNGRNRGSASVNGGQNRGGRGGNASGGGGSRGPPAYKSLDDYSSGNFDGANDQKAGGNAGMVMDY
jgi:hypothetical protein